MPRIDNLNIQLGLQDGSLSAPSLYFYEDRDTGMFRDANDTINFVANGDYLLELNQGVSIFPHDVLIEGTTNSYGYGELTTLAVGSATLVNLPLDTFVFGGNQTLGSYDTGTDILTILHSGNYYIHYMVSFVEQSVNSERAARIQIFKNNSALSPIIPGSLIIGSAEASNEQCTVDLPWMGALNATDEIEFLYQSITDGTARPTYASIVIIRM